VVNLTTLAPDIVAAILDETLSLKVTLSRPAVGRQMFNMKTRPVRPAGIAYSMPRMTSNGISAWDCANFCAGHRPDRSKPS
jgi:hypothetical protein